MFGVDIGHHHNRGAEQQKGPVALVGLSDQEPALPEPSIRTQNIQLAADHHGGIQVRARQHSGHQRGGGGFAVGTGHGDAVLEAHQLR